MDSVVTMIEHELGNMPNAALRRLAASGVPTTAAAAQAELDSRPSASSATEDESWIRAVFPQRPDPFA